MHREKIENKYTEFLMAILVFVLVPFRWIRDNTKEFLAWVFVAFIAAGSVGSLIFGIIAFYNENRSAF